MVVKRTINGGTVRFVERLATRFIAANDMDHASARFVDAYLDYEGSATSTLSNADHLEGETVQVLADGATHPDVQVSSGSVTLSRSVTKAVLGLGTTWRLTPLPLEAADALDTVGKQKRVAHADVGVYQSLGLSIQVDAYAIEEIPDRQIVDPMNAPPPLFTGRHVNVTPESSAESTQTSLTLTGSQPLPATINAIIATLEVDT